MTGIPFLLSATTIKRRMDFFLTDSNKVNYGKGLKCMKRRIVFFAMGLLVLNGVRVASGANEVGAGDVVWSPNPCVAVFEGPDYSGSGASNCTVRIAGTRNGTFCGQAVFFSKTVSKGVAARVSDLKERGGTGVIMASAVSISYAAPAGSERDAHRRFPGVKGLRRFDALLPEPVEEPLRTHVVWMKVRIPADANPGAYEGTLTVDNRNIPVELSVAGWKLPDPSGYLTHVGLLQSPDSVAMQYQVEAWSDRHFELIGKSFDLMAEVGNKVAVIPVICKTHFGNEQGMVVWIKDGDKYKYDFSRAEKYLDLYIKRIGRPKVVCFYLWEIFCGGNYLGNGDGKAKFPTEVTLFDPIGRTNSLLIVPDPSTPEAETFWKPVMDGLHEMLRKRGLDDESFMLGVAGDVRPGKIHTELFQKVAPYARWFIHSHSKGDKINGVEVGYVSHVWGTRQAPDPDQPPKQTWDKNYFYGWQQKQQITLFPRYGGNISPPLWADAPLGVHREVGEAALSGNLRGFGRVGADFWPVMGSGKDRRPVTNRYQQSNLSQLSLDTSSTAVLHPGPSGALSTIRFENIREGVQECEAKIFIEKALLDRDSRAGMGEKAAVYEELLKKRIRALRDSSQPPKGKVDAGWDWFASRSGWQDRTESIFAAAAEISKTPGVRPVP